MCVDRHGQARKGLSSGPSLAPRLGEALVVNWPRRWASGYRDGRVGRPGTGPLGPCSKAHRAPVGGLVVLLLLHAWLS